MYEILSMLEDLKFNLDFLLADTVALLYDPW